MLHWCCWCSKKSTPLLRLFNKGEEQVEKDLDLVKIIRSVRNIKLYLKKSTEVDALTKTKLKLAGKNLILLDHSGEDVVKEAVSMSESIVNHVHGKQVKPSIPNLNKSE
jgi:nicotinate-nucleotide pyrophosphorylase